MTDISVDLRLGSVHDFFNEPRVDPLSGWFEDYSLLSGIDYVIDEVGDRPRVNHVAITVRLPPDAIEDDLEGRLQAGIVKYCNAHLRIVEQAAAEDRSRGWLMMAFSVVAVVVLVWVAQRFSGSGDTLLGVAAEGLSIAAWVMLWHPLEELVFDRWDYRLDRRAFRTVRDCSTVHVVPLTDAADA